MRPTRILVPLLLALLPAPALAAQTWTVTRTDDPGGSCVHDGDCSLRQALNSSAAGDTVVIPANPTPITLVATISVNKNLTITGAGARKSTISGGGTTQMFSLGGAGSPTIAMSGLTLTNGHVTASNAFGGAMLTVSGTFTLTDVAVVGNTATATGTNVIGGGIATSGSNLILDRVLIANNTVEGGVSQFGGGIGNGGTLTIRDSTITGNHAVGAGGAGGGGISGGSGSTAKVTLTGVTMFANTASGGGGNIYANISGGGFFKLSRSIIAGGTAAGGANCSVAGGTITSLGDNIESLNQCGLGAGEKHDTDPVLGALGDHGGPTDTLALGAGSPAFRSASGCTGTDQRGFARPAACSIGALEPQGPAVAPTASPTGASAGQAVTFTANVTDAEGDASTPAWTFDDGATANGAAVEHAFATAGDHSATVTVTDATGLTATGTATVTVVATGDPPPQQQDDGPAPDTVVPVIAQLVRAKGGKVSFTLSEAAFVGAVLERCRNRRCTRRKPAGSLRRAFTAGPQKLRRVGPRHPAAGRYRLTLVATDAAGNRSKPARVRFRIAPK